MDSLREPRLNLVPILDLRPTQITVGLREVEVKRKRWRAQSDSKAAAFLGKHTIPVILGPNQRHYVIDQHHLTRALHEEGVKEIVVTVVADLSALERDSFWFNLDSRNWMHPYDAEGRRRGHDEIPKSVSELVDDPYRSLAGELRRLGGFAKDTTPFSEFLWADFLRRRVEAKLLEQDFSSALELASSLAKGPEAGYLPGWCGPTGDT